MRLSIHIVGMVQQVTFDTRERKSVELPLEQKLLFLVVARGKVAAVPINDRLVIFGAEVNGKGPREIIDFDETDVAVINSNLGEIVLEKVV